ncbi:MAG: 1-acyl-sn-glycerol-3-phosphate acyltransferase [Balneolaceae bacterium]|jgi:1-acyl-sn-glycerol-3-phosphate acyltransferase|nr:MAG: 1-acyl-sn-glycerol-3-phosphate acyltransferase [Balneolaceae bacterium]
MSTDSNSTITAADLLRSLSTMAVFLLLLVIATPIMLILMVITFGKAGNFVVEKIAPLLARPALAVAGVKFYVKNHTGSVPSPAVYIINHSSTLDMLTLLAMGLPAIRFVAKWQLQYNPVFFVVGRLTGQVFIRRERSEKAVATLKKNISRLRRQKLSIMLAPEGSRKHEGIIGPFKKGAFHMALELGYPIVPIYFEGNRELNPGGTLITKKGTVVAHIHPPVDTSQWDKSTLSDHVESVRNLYLKWAGAETGDHLKETG